MISKLLQFLFVVVVMPSFAYAYSDAKELPRPERWVRVTDPQSYLSEGERKSIDKLLEDHRVETGHQIAVVIVNKIEKLTPKQFAVDLFASWQIGEKGKDNGLLILMAINNRRIEYEVGYGLEGILPDITCKSIQEEYMLPEFKRGNYFAGLNAGLSETIQLLSQRETPMAQEGGGSRSDGAVATTSLSAQFQAAPPLSEPGSPFDFVFSLFAGVFVCAFLYMFGLMGWSFYKEAKSANQIVDPKARAKEFDSIILAGFCFSGMILTFVFTPFVISPWICVYYAFTGIRKRFGLSKLPTPQDQYLWLARSRVPLFAYYLVPIPCFFFEKWDERKLRALRAKPHSCPKCSKQMVLLSEKDEIEHLSLGQQTEQRVKSVDHDVWYCEDDQAVSIFHAYAQYTDRTECPECQALTWALKSDRTIVAATYSSSGRGEKTFKCDACEHTTIESYVIPIRRQSSSSSGSSSSGGSSGGGYSGGGSSGGGGAGSSW